MRLHIVQVLRCVAALSVLSGHVIGAGARMGSYKTVALPTGAGVDLFFAISGFIMVFASTSLFARQGAASEFLRKRLIRLVPLYWLCTTAMLALVLTSDKIVPGLPNLGYVLSSYLFIPDDSYGSVDGVAFPLLSLGWTLNYEMLFYAVFSAFIFLPRRLAIAGVTACLILAALIGSVAASGSVVLSTWTQPIVLEFALGMIIGHAFLQGAHWTMGLRGVALAAAIAWLAFDPCGLLTLHQTPNDMRRLIGWGLPAALILAAAVLGPSILPSRAERAASLLGDASYSLYLTHPFVLIGGRYVWLKVIGPHHTVWFVGLTIGAAVIASVIIHTLVELPLARTLRPLGRSRLTDTRTSQALLDAFAEVRKT